MQTTCPHRRPRPASACSVAASRHVPAGHWSDGGNSCILTPCPLSHSHCRLAAAPELRMIYEWQEGAAWTEGSDSGPGTLLKIYQQRTETVNKPNTCLWKVAGRGFWLIDFFRPYFKNQKLKQVFWGFFVFSTVAFVQLLMNRTDVCYVKHVNWQISQNLLYWKNYEVY